MSAAWSTRVHVLAAAGLVLVLAACGPAEESEVGGTSGTAGSPPPAAASGASVQQQPSRTLAYSPGAAVPAPAPHPAVDFGGERYQNAPGQGLVEVARQPLSTFSVDVDTASYVHVRRILRAGQLPPPEAVRVEELVNYFRYAYPEPRDPREPFAVTATVLPNPWDEETRLLHVGLKAYGLGGRARPRANLVFLVDVSGSMEGPDRLELAKQALVALLGRLRAEDRVALVTFADGAEQALASTPVRRKAEIERVIAGLSAGGGTGGAGGLQLAYSAAAEHFEKDAVNRVILISDGEFNVGTSDPEGMRRLIESKRRTGVYLTVLTVGSGNVNDHIAQALAQSGNGQAAHLDSLVEARRVLDDELEANLVPIADDVKMQIEFNPRLVAAYRLLGYETRALADRDFRNDRIDAGEVGSGHSVTALYEIVPAGAESAQLDPLRYQESDRGAQPVAGNDREYAFVKLRYKRPGKSASRQLERPVTLEDQVEDLAAAPADLRFAVAVAAFGALLRRDLDPEDFGFDEVFALARDSRRDDPLGLRGEFLQLIRQAEGLAQAGW